jgi:hypothetical protein
MQATDQPPVALTERGARSPHIETWSENDRLRHIPSIDWIVQKLDGDLRRRIEILWLPYSDLAASDPRHAPLEAEFRSLCRSLERLADVARRGRGAAHPPVELGGRIRWTVDHAVSALSSVDPKTFGHRFPFHTFERSSGEPLWAAMLRIIEQVKQLTTLVRDIEPDVDEKLYEGLVKLSEPLRREPIA